MRSTEPNTAYSFLFKNVLKKGDDMAPLTENDGSNTPVREIVFYNLTVNQRLG